MAFDPITAALSLGNTLIDRLVPDTNAREAEKAKLSEDMAQAGFQADAAQTDINKIEAASPSIFVAGPRPMAMWVCVFTMGWSWVLAPAITWAVQIWAPHTPALPVIGSDESQTLLYALLGLGGLRTFDKLKGTDTQNISGLPWKK